MTEKAHTPKEIPQYNLPQILFMYAWPIAWFMFLIYVVGPYFVTPDGTFPLWAENLIGLLGNGAEISEVQTLDRTGKMREEKEESAWDEIGKKSCFEMVSLSFRSTNKPE